MKFLIGGDKHIREDTPVCRTDNYWEAQDRKLKFIRNLYDEHGIDWELDSGDIFDHWKPSPFLLGYAINNLGPQISVPGNHDLPQHNIELTNKSGFGVLEAAGIVNPDDYYDTLKKEGIEIYQVPYGGEIPKKPEFKGNFNILICHELIYTGKSPYPGAEKEGSQARAFLMEHEFDLIVTGHNHQTIVENYKGRWLINPGSMMRMTAIQEEHRPCVFIVDTSTSIPEVEDVFLPITTGVVSREHITLGEERDSRVDAFLARLKGDVELKLSYRANLIQYMKKNLVRKQVEEIIWEAVDGK